MLRWTRGFRKDEQAQSLIEYTLLLAFVVFVALGMSGAFHSSMAQVASLSNSQLTAATCTLAQ